MKRLILQKDTEGIFRRSFEHRVLNSFEQWVTHQNPTSGVGLDTDVRSYSTSDVVRHAAIELLVESDYNTAQELVWFVNLFAPLKD
jgi:hypothetical protein